MGEFYAQGSVDLPHLDLSLVDIPSLDRLQGSRPGAR